ncbi:MAG: phosphotransferase [Pseudomonadota bacterium]
MAKAIWTAACASDWAQAPVWVHGDVAPGNPLVEGGELAAVIDFCQLAISDTACDVFSTFRRWYSRTRPIAGRGPTRLRRSPRERAAPAATFRQ